MAGQTWFEAPSLIEKLKAQPETFSYFQALRLLSLAHQSDFDSTVDLMRRGLMVRAGVELGFPSSDLQAVTAITAETTDNDGSDIADIPSSAGHLYRLTVTFMGLYGSASPLPPFYATEILDDVLNDENASRNLLDIISLPSYRNHCEAYFHCRLPYRLLEEDDPLCLEILHCLLGLGHKPLLDRINAPQKDMPFISLFARYVQPSQGLITYFSERFGLESAELNQCVLRQALIPAEQRCRLGGPETQHRQLGQGALLGSQVRDLRGKFQILLPVSDLKLFQRLMPGGGLRRDLEEAVNRYLIEPLLYELVLRLSPGTASGIVLGQGPFRRLGLSAFLSPRDDREITVISRAGTELNFEEGIEDEYAAA